MAKEVEVVSYGNPLEGSEKSVENANLELVMRVAAQAKALAPVDLGQLKGSIMWKVPGKDGGHEEGPVVSAEPDEGDGLVGSATEYAAYQEFGTRKMAAQPYLRPAVTLEVLGPNGANVMKEESIKAMTAALNKGKKKI